MCVGVFVWPVRRSRGTGGGYRGGSEKRAKQIIKSTDIRIRLDNHRHILHSVERSKQQENGDEERDKRMERKNREGSIEVWLFSFFGAT